MLGLSSSWPQVAAGITITLVPSPRPFQLSLRARDLLLGFGSYQVQQHLNQSLFQFILDSDSVHFFSSLPSDWALSPDRQGVSPQSLPKDHPLTVKCARLAARSGWRGLALGTQHSDIPGYYTPLISKAWKADPTVDSKSLGSEHRLTERRARQEI